MSRFEIPQELIAITPAKNRTDSRLLVFDRATMKITHSNISEIGRWLKAGDVMVLNNTKVDRARVEWKKPTGGASELLLLRFLSEAGTSSKWEAIVSGKSIQTNVEYTLPGEMQMKVLTRSEGSQVTLEMLGPKENVLSWLGRFGKPPLPPYIRKARKRAGIAQDLPEDVERYQTVFAGKPGAVAAPTAGLHFTPELLSSLEKKGVSFEYLTLAVGWGTFQPLTESHFKEGKLHPEWTEISGPTAKRILEAKEARRRIVAVGTTTVRSLEWWQIKGSPTNGYEGWCDLFLRPPWQSTLIDALLTNFHLADSSLLLLVAGFLGEDGEEKIRHIYDEAIREKYRFYSFGDAMLVI